MKGKLAVWFFALVIVNFSASSLLWAEAVRGVVIRGGERVPYCRVHVGGNRSLADQNGNFIMVLNPGDHPVRVEGQSIEAVIVDGRPAEMVRVAPGAETTIEIRLR